MAPANNKKLSITFINTVLKSIALIISVVFLKKLGLKKPTQTIPNDTTIDIIIMPIVAGNFKNLKFM